MPQIFHCHCALRQCIVALVDFTEAHGRGFIFSPARPCSGGGASAPLQHSHRTRLSVLGGIDPYTYLVDVLQRVGVDPGRVRLKGDDINDVAMIDYGFPGDEWKR